MTLVFLIEETIFATPYDGLVGTVMAFMPVKGKSKRIAHATLYSEKAPDITIEAPKSLTLEQVVQMADHYKAFVVKVKSHSQE
ncbi:hypothetical protein F2S72_08890 [Pseudomonas syringae pv. actinidiae]|nr:hypothetical protein [Pseudomonas syringae pv. actinidiae]